MKNTPLKPSDKPMARGGLPAPTKAQELVFRKLSDQIGCVVCLFHCRHPDGSRVEGSITQIHHILSGGYRISHDHVLPLCKMHHDEGTPGNPSRHSIMGKYGKAEFEAKYGDEMELVLECEEWINIDYCTGSDNNTKALITDEQQEITQDDDDHYTGADADSERDSGYGEVEPIQVCESKATHNRYIATVVHYRFRLADSDNLNAKGALDGFVNAGVLEDDAPKYIEETRHRQVKVENYAQEKTEITLREIERSEPI